MKKKFAFLGFHVGEQINKTNLKKWDFVNKNPVMFKTDRFLEKKFMEDGNSSQLKSGYPCQKM